MLGGLLAAVFSSVAVATAGIALAVGTEMLNVS
jgi:hypothetical protein